MRGGGGGGGRGVEWSGEGGILSQILVFDSIHCPHSVKVIDIFDSIFFWKKKLSSIMMIKDFYVKMNLY